MPAQLCPPGPRYLPEGGIGLTQPLVFNPVWLICSFSQAPFAVGFVICIVAFKPLNVAVTLEGQNMRGNTIQKPAIVRNHYRAAGEVEQCLFQCTQGFDIQVIGRFVEQQQVAATSQ